MYRAPLLPFVAIRVPPGHLRLAREYMYLGVPTYLRDKHI